MQALTACLDSGLKSKDLRHTCDLESKDLVPPLIEYNQLTLETPSTNVEKTSLYRTSE